MANKKYFVVGSLMLAGVLAICVMVQTSRRPANAPDSRSHAQTPRVTTGAGLPGRPGVTHPESRATPLAKASGKRRGMLDWQRELYDPQTTARAFADAIGAAESGDLVALREIHDLLVLCRQVMAYVRDGGDRETWMAGHTPPPNGIRWFEPFYDRCAVIASAPAFSRWPLHSGKLTAEYWKRLAVGFDDPLFRSFEIAEAASQAERREDIAGNLKRVLRSADMTAWRDLGGRLFYLGLTADQSVGLALIQVACARGYDCTRSNVHNLSLQCDAGFDSNCDAATTLPEYFALSESPAINARAQALAEQLMSLLDRQDWEAIEKLVPLDGPVFNKQD